MSGYQMASLALVTVLSTSVAVQAIGGEPRARGLGIPFDGTPGKLNAITDVAGVEVGHETLISGKGKLKVGSGPVRTGVTAILPRGKGSTDPVFAGSDPNLYFVPSGVVTTKYSPSLSGDPGAPNNRSTFQAGSIFNRHSFAAIETSGDA